MTIASSAPLGPPYGSGASDPDVIGGVQWLGYEYNIYAFPIGTATAAAAYHLYGANPAALGELLRDNPQLSAGGEIDGPVAVPNYPNEPVLSYSVYVNRSPYPGLGGTPTGGGTAGTLPGDVVQAWDSFVEWAKGGSPFQAFALNELAGEIAKEA